MRHVPPERKVVGCRKVVKWIWEKRGVRRLNLPGSRCGLIPGLRPR
jgi:hypothetical protein